MRLIHYSKKPLTKVLSRLHKEDGAGAYKTPGLWVSVEGEDDWPAWCKSEQWGLETFGYTTEVILAPENTVLRLKSVKEIDAFTQKYCTENRRYENDRNVEWDKVRGAHQGLIISPYQWARRLSPHTRWYYGWNCASGVIWDAAAVAELRPAKLPDMSGEDRLKMLREAVKAVENAD